MLFVDNEQNNDPRVNLAIEEYLLRKIKLTEDILLFYINGPSVIIGRNQNAIEEINGEYVDAHNIHVVRRLSGGGAVYHDLGNLNYSLITRGGKEDATNFKKFTAPVIRALNEMGIAAALSGRNDILVDERKVSGNAIYSAHQGIVCHGTLLLNTDLSVLSNALNVKPQKIESKGIKSVRSRVANISEYMKEPMDILEFRTRILHSIFEGSENVTEYHLTAEDWEGIRKLSDERYKTWAWNYGRSPAFNIQKVQRFAFGEVDARIQVSEGVVQSVKFYGDFFGQHDVADLEARLKGVRYEPASLTAALEGADMNGFFAGFSAPEFVSFFY